MLSRVVRRRLAAASLREFRASTSNPCRGAAQRRWATPAPRAGDGPLMSRRADRELPGTLAVLATGWGHHRLTEWAIPDIKQVRFRWGRSLPIFLALVAVSSLAIFNYQKTSSPIVSSTLYALRTSPRARALLGDDVYFKHQIPWIRGTMNQMQGRIDIYFSVRGTRGTATMRFASHRPSSRSLFETTEWSLVMDGSGEWVDLLEGGDPFRGLLGDDVAAVALPPALEEDVHATRGFRQQGVLNK
ncbi:Cytochrome c oxidase assembly factor 1 [Tolypocladium ophioglossoides CBS 100239]|uniref:Cytochrome c oxidase assembly factor 1 n=1 Tax=Tolypocladium ophioglossoides (strain CBS 100239) TaxID=1163406 RepID=A0A0L0NKB0_TOLOC|nr:Cytochrome c oxidase assembly factor 1 [Tolypocladium ophioglossoides CBS 100239]